MIFNAEPIENLADFGSKGFFRPCGEVTPVVFGFFPKNFDHVEFRAVEWQVANKGIESLHPAQGDCVIRCMMETGIVQNNESRFRIGDLRNRAQLLGYFHYVLLGGSS